jgi:hypothetical protein
LDLEGFRVEVEVEGEVEVEVEVEVWCLVSGGLVGFVEVGIRNAGMQEGRLWEGVINFV